MDRKFTVEMSRYRLTDQHKPVGERQLESAGTFEIHVEFDRMVVPDADRQIRSPQRSDKYARSQGTAQSEEVDSTRIRR